MDLIFSAVLLLLVAISVVWSVFVRKLAKTRIRSISVIACVLLALIGTFVIKSVVLDPAFAKDMLSEYGSSLPGEVTDIANSSSLLFEFVLGVPVALVSPLVFVILYIVLSLLAGIVYLFILIFGRKAFKKSNKKDIPYARAKCIAWSAVSSVLALIVILIPVAFYGGLANDAVSAVANMDEVDAEMKDTLNMVSEDYLTPIADGMTVDLFRAFGGDVLLNEMTAFTIEGETVYLRSEVNAIFDVVNSVMPLTKGFEDCGEEEADALVAAIDSLTNSKLLTAISAEAICIYTEDIATGEKPIKVDDSEMFDGLVNKTITILYNDAKSENDSERTQYKADLKTVALMMSDFIKGGVLSNIEDTEAMMDELANGDTIEKVIRDLGYNSSMKCLIPEVTNIGIKAIANAVEVKEDADEVYNELMNTIAADLNSVKNETNEAKKVYDLSLKLTDAFDNAGIAIDKQVIHLYSVAMIQGIINEAGAEEITAANVQDFFVIFANSADQVDTADLAAGTEAANSAPAVLARLIYAISALDAKTNEAQLANILATEAQAMLGTTESVLYKVIVEGVEIVVLNENNEPQTKSVGPVKVKRNLDSIFVDGSEDPKYDYAIQEKFYSTSTFENTKALRSAETMKEKSLLIFMDEIVIDVDNVGDFDADIEAKAIGGIFSKAGSLMNDVSGEEELDLGKMAGSVGAILNSLNGSECVGEEKTANLFIAIIQSSMVRDSANMDIGTATQLGVKGTVKNANGDPVDYEKTFKTISNTMDVLQNMNSNTDEGMSEEDLSAVLKDLNPQTAGMIESYITEDRLADDYGLDAEQSTVAAPLISDVFGYMGSQENMSEEDCQKEAAALNDVMTLVTGASDRAQSEETNQAVFGKDNNSVMGKDADETVATFMASESLKASLENNNESLENDPFGMQGMMSEESEDKTQLLNAMNKYYTDTEYESEEAKQKDADALNNLGKLFGLSSTDMETVFGTNN